MAGARSRGAVIPLIGTLSLLVWQAGLPWVARAERRQVVVQPGDVLVSIARDAGVTVEALRSWNDLDGDFIRDGQALWLDPPAGQAVLAEAPEDAPGYLVQEGDTLGHIAVRLDTSVEALLEANPGLEPDHIRAGQRLHVPSAGRRVRHEVQPGEVLLNIARKYEVSIQQILDWNGDVVPERLRAGRPLVIYTKLPASHSLSVGRPNAGSLEHAERLPRHPGYYLRDPQRAWGTHETVHAVVGAFDALRRADPRAPKVRVHDLSLREGGPISDHSSHQSGRDVDITYFQRDCGKRPCPLRRIGPRDLDVARQWKLLEHWLLRGLAEAVFIDYRLQRALYQHARKQGATRQELALWFQYPRGPGAAAGIIRHVPKHADHMHVRFVCDETDAECQQFRVYPTMLANR